jgi:hypothetical protein
MFEVEKVRIKQISIIINKKKYSLLLKIFKSFLELVEKKISITNMKIKLVSIKK